MPICQLDCRGLVVLKTYIVGSRCIRPGIFLVLLRAQYAFLVRSTRVPSEAKRSAIEL